MAAGWPSYAAGIFKENQKSWVLRRVSKDIVGFAKSSNARTAEGPGVMDLSTCSHTLTGRGEPVPDSM